jgi:hypothetical protein
MRASGNGISLRAWAVISWSALTSARKEIIVASTLDLILEFLKQ